MTLFHTPRPAAWLACASCGSELRIDDRAVRCTCGGLLDVRHRAPDWPGQVLRERFQARCCTRAGSIASGVWRFGELVLPDLAHGDVVSHPEGNTPLLARARVSAWAGVEGLLLKHEGHNPTGSFKDRGMTVGVTQAVRVGASAVVCASTGNTAASLAAYAAQAGLDALVLVPEGRVAMGKLAQTVGYGATILAVRGDFDACLRLVESSAGDLGLYVLNSINPFRLEGQKTIVLELLQQLAWEAPDWIVLPGGNLGNTAAFGKALEEARDWGLISRVPRLAVVQAAGAAPFARSFATGFRTRTAVSAETIATAIRIGDPASFDRAVRAIRFTDGIVTSVPDEEILAGKLVIDRAGVGCEPASAASVAGLRQLVREGIVHPGDRVVAVLTGHMLKDPPAATGEAIVVDPTVEAVAGAIAEKRMRTGRGNGKDGP